VRDETGGAINHWLFAEIGRKGTMSGSSDASTNPVLGEARAEHADDVAQKYLNLLADYNSVKDLAQSGATAFAQKRFDELGLGSVEQRFAELGLGGTPPHEKLRIDIGALEGRLAKDRAVATEDAAERVKLLNHAADIYEAVFEQTRSDYPLVNVAALRLWAGDQGRSRRAAATVLEILGGRRPEDQDYWYFATLAEAHLLTGDTVAASHEIELAAAYERRQPMVHWQAFASTSRQLKRSCRLLGLSDAFLAPLHVPPLIVYAGDRPGPRLSAAHEAALASTIQAELERRESHIGVGGLAAGADILFAEALLERGADLHVVLACSADIFIEEAVAPFGAHWVDRFNRCLAKARTVKHATNYGYQGHSAPMRYACRLAMGQAILRARSFDADAIMLSVCDAEVPLAEDAFDPAEDVAFWSGTGRRAFAIAAEGRVTEIAKPQVRPAGPTTPDGSINAAVLFGDLHGFSKMPESSVLKYAERILGGVGAIFDRYAPHLLSRNSWGDAIFAQFDNVSMAAQCAVDVQNMLKHPEIAELDPGVHMSMRIGLHYGPVQRVFDRVQERVGYMGIHVVEAARIEPIAVPGMIYVSEAFAVALAVDPETKLVCEYLGEVDTAKKFGRAPLYELRPSRLSRVAG
jgi:class 3 adenylate cyclase